MDPPSSSSSSSSNIYHPNPNWLSFSLFHPTPLASSSVDHPPTEEDPPPPPPLSVTDPSIFAGSVPQLADFFGGTALADHFPPPPVEDNSPVVISDLKTIAASFLRGFSGDGSRMHDDGQMHRPQELQLAVSNGGRQQQVGKKAVDTFGQRTSIYRGVTR